ncbi:Phospholipase D zeta 1 [Nymphaea thermarum]|nr:Phospholipase D zeta 1 [Nymphaea thermarum]
MDPDPTNTYRLTVTMAAIQVALVNKVSQVFFLHFALKKRAIIEEFHEKQELVKEWLQNLGIGEQIVVAQDEEMKLIMLLQHYHTKKTISGPDLSIVRRPSSSRADPSSSDVVPISSIAQHLPSTRSRCCRYHRHRPVLTIVRVSSVIVNLLPSPEY